VARLQTDNLTKLELIKHRRIFSMWQEIHKRWTYTQKRGDARESKGGVVK